MKNILKTYRAEWLVNVLNGNADILIAKNFPKDFVGWIYIYCPKEKNKHDQLKKEPEYSFSLDKDGIIKNKDYLGNGKVVARFWCDKVESIKWAGWEVIENGREFWETDTLDTNELEKKSCLSNYDLASYLGNSKSGEFGYAIHISKLEVFDKPRELSEFYKPLTRETCMCGCEKNCKICECRLTNSPQNYCYIEGEE